MPDLTLEQVKSAEIYAECNVDAKRYWVWNPDDGDLSLRLPMNEADSLESRLRYSVPIYGWHHMRGCDCEFCK